MQRHRLATWLVLTLLLGGATARAFVRPDVAIWNAGGHYTHAVGWRYGSAYYRWYSPPQPLPPNGYWPPTADGRAIPADRRWGWSACGVLSRYVDYTAGRQHTWTFTVPLVIPLAIAGFVLIRAIAGAAADHRRTVRRRLGLCPNCGYDQRATPYRCPECGSAMRVGGDLARGTRRRSFSFSFSQSSSRSKSCSCSSSVSTECINTDQEREWEEDVRWEENEEQEKD